MEQRANPKVSSSGRFWKISVACGLLVHLIGLVLLSVDPVPETPILVERPYLTLTPAGQQPQLDDFGGFDRVALLDTAPLYLPNRWNTNSGNLDAIRSLRPRELFDPFPPRLSFAESPAAAELSLRLETAADPWEIVLGRDRFPFSSLGRVDSERPGGPARFARVGVFRFGESVPIVEIEVSPDEVADAFEEAVYPGDPMTLSVQVSAFGGLGSLILVESSGRQELDAFFRHGFRARLRDAWREAGELTAGYYRVEVGP